jgi:hypothetical protein
VNNSLFKLAFELSNIEPETACRMAQGRIQELKLIKGSFDMAREGLAALKVQQDKKTNSNSGGT